jgi:hypothetical protein
MKLIETKTLTVAAASIEFTSIPQTFTDLVLLGSTRSSVAGNNSDNVFMSANAVVSGYSSRNLTGSGTVVSSGINANNITTKTHIGIAAATAVAGSGWGSTTVYIPNYKGSTNKSYSVDATTEGNSSTQNEVVNTIVAGLMPVTAAITSLTITLASGSNFTAGTIFSLYGVTSGSDGIVTVS